ncbi:transcription factor HIVEP3 isoform X1 [Hypomesus transpacificus]|uniref:transcription factor HIVEP3 isoform X1 n=1 Tax=Hypomesus transpacificus TaxID=137520 RepID=UPI001F07E282|nr:transcription factor HIVEP3 isoform X1 [Hypomesus transpacificus]XP_046875737.1 transcription factor HIVEP3 isoform X1 [Hypomesus transpacificus]XP_046875738.1 transcription factor HIVEP3 isoform X1 [Hypomesus transpacificus]XP_046875739.1 transcription factor HIVEP3 isoform X1 [Hypomesus transpacificus]
MEALHSHLTTGEQSGVHKPPQPGSPQPRSPSPKNPPQSPQSKQQPHDTSQQHKQPKRQPPERKRLKHQRQSVDSDTGVESKRPEPASQRAGRVSSGPPGPTPSTPSRSTQTRATEDSKEGILKQKREHKPQRPGKYVCSYCGRACAKPSVLQKHIRSHTGERPYPCGPCGFSFKTKSNLYKHRKSHTHRVKAGLATAEPRALEEPATESEDESRQLSSAASMDRQGSVCTTKNVDSERSNKPPRGMDDSFAVKKRLAMRLSRGKRGPLGSFDEKSSSLILASRGSTESGYFSRSESTEQSQDSPPNTSAKSYAEIILGKYGRLGHLQRMSRHHNQQPSGQEENNIPFTVPKKQVIDHITKLITINEAVVDTSKIDSVKPRRFSLSRRSSSESPKASSLKEPTLNSPKAAEPGFQSSGSITMGVPCNKFHHQSLNVNSFAGQTSTAPLLRSQSMPSAASSTDASRTGPRSFRLSQSFDEQKASETQLSRRYGILKRQPAIELPIGAELPKEELPVSQPHYHHHMSAVPDHKQCQLQPYECESCGTGCRDWEGYKTHKQSLCLAQRTLEGEIAICQSDRLNLTHHLTRPGALTIRKRRKEESFELDDPSSPVLATSLPVFPSSVPGRDESSKCYETPGRTAWPQVEKSGRSSGKGFSVIQHTSSFERQETLCGDSKALEEVQARFPPDKESQKRSQQTPSKPAPRKLVRQHNVQVPEILVTEDSNTASVSVSLPVPASIPKQMERTDEFQWPQRSPTLAQLPIEKLPPKKKRLRLAEAAQSSGESSFDSTSLPHSPSQDSSASYASSRSASFEESNRLDMEAAGTTTPLRRSRAPHTLPVPGLHPHREMRRSASEQAPHDPPHSVLMAETRSKSFDYSCLSPERSAAGWRERRKCLLMRHTVVRDPEEEEQPSKCGALKMNPSHSSTSPDPTSSSALSRASPGPLPLSSTPASSLSTEAMSCNSTPLSQSVQSTRCLDVLPSQNPAHEPLPLAKLIQSGQCSSISIHPFPPQSAQFPTGAARAHYLPMSTGLQLKIPSQDHVEPELTPPSQMAPRQPNITPSSEMLRPPVSQAVAVRVHADTLSPARCIYTTMSQTMCPRSQEPMCSALNIGTSEYKLPVAMSLDSQMGSMEGFRTSGSGGNKRMLSPSSSIELSPESQQQQKRVKEHEKEKEEERFGDETETSREEKESHPSPASQSGPSFPSLQSSTSFSWCYLNYIKPNPSTLDEQQPSVYSSWSTSEFDPNPPGLSSKTAMSLLQCKQSSSPSIYTMSAMSSSTIETPQPSDTPKPCSSEVHDTVTACDHNQAQTKDDQRSAEHQGNILKEKEEGEPRSSNQDGEPSRIWVCEGGYRSNEEYVYVWGRGRGRYVCEECGIRCRKPSMLHKHIRLHTDARPYVCKHCNFAFKTKGNLTKHMKSKAHGKKSHEWPMAGCSLDYTEADEGISEDCPGWPETQEDHQYSDLEETDEEEDEDDDDNEDDEEPWYRPNPHSAAPHKLTSLPDRPAELESSQSSEPKWPERGYPAPTTSAKRALLSHHHAEPPPGTASSGAHIPSPGTPSPGQRQSPARTLSQKSDPSAQHSPSLGVQLSPALRHGSPPSSLSPSSCHVSPSPGRQPSPSRAQSPGGSPSGSPAPCLPGSSALHRPSSPREAPSDTPMDRAGCFTPMTRLQRTQLVQGSRPPHLLPRPGLPQGVQGVLSHLPLHSQQLARTPSLMIPIGGIHMVQPRTSPLYSLVRSPVTAPAPYGPGGEHGAWTAGLRKNLLGRFPSLERQDSLREGGPSSHTSHQDHRVREVRDRKCTPRVCLGTRAAGSPGEESEPCCSAQGDSSHTHAQGVTHTHTPDGSVFPETSQGQSSPPSCQTKL